MDSEIVTKYESIDDKVFMTLEESLVLARELARRLEGFRKRPEVVVGVANGALLISDVVAKQLSIPMHAIRIQRRGTGIKQALSRIPGMRGMFSFLYRVPVLNAPLVWAMRRLEGLKKSRSGQPLPVSNKIVALVDDCIESGQTIAAAREMLTKSGAQAVVVACISWSKLRDSNAAHGVRPDIFISKRVQHYPWSTNSPYWKDYLDLLKGRGIKLA